MTRCLFPLLAVLLVGCSEQPSVIVTIKDGSIEQEYCSKASNILVEKTMQPAKLTGGAIGTGENLIVRCAVDATGKAECGKIDCIEHSSHTVAVTHTQVMSPEEFNFRYQNDPTFKASVQSYSFE